MQRDVLVISMKSLNLNASLDDKVKARDDANSQDKKEKMSNSIEDNYDYDGNDDDFQDELEDAMADLQAHAVDKDTDALIKMAL